MRIIYCIFFFFLLIQAQAQPNLVPNGSFEDFLNNQCPDQAERTLHYLPPWQGMHFGALFFDPLLVPDLRPELNSHIVYASCLPSPYERPGCVNCLYGTDLPWPLHGNNVVAMGWYGYSRLNITFRYPLGTFAGVSSQVRLTAPLKKGYKYSLSYFVYGATYQFQEHNCYDVYFGKDPVYFTQVDTFFGGGRIFYSFRPLTSTGYDLRIEPHPAQVRYTGVPLKMGQWHKLTADFVADGGEEYMWIGCLRDSLSVQKVSYNVPVEVGSTQLSQMIFLDSVTVREWVNQRATEGRVPGYVTATPIDPIDTTQPPVVEQALKIPNVITPNGDGLNDYWVIDGLPEGSAVIIHNRWGNTVFSEAPYRHRFSAEGLEAGTYFYLITEPNGTFHKGPLRVIKE